DASQPMTNSAGDARPSIVNVVAPGRFGGAGSGAPAGSGRSRESGSGRAALAGSGRARESGSGLDAPGTTSFGSSVMSERGAMRPESRRRQPSGRMSGDGSGWDAGRVHGRGGGGCGT